MHTRFCVPQDSAQCPLTSDVPHSAAKLWHGLHIGLQPGPEGSEECLPTGVAPSEQRFPCLLLLLAGWQHLHVTGPGQGI